jgi:predicted site-specific integrase-resolvase
VEHSDRLTRFRFDYITALYHGHIIFINRVVTDKEDLMQDSVIQVIDTDIAGDCLTM